MSVISYLHSLLSVRLCVIAACCSLLLAGGCASRHNGPESGRLSLSVPEDAAPPLTSTEKAVLQRSGQIDKNIPDDAMQNVTRQYKYFLRKGRPIMRASAKRAEQFLAYSQRVFRSRGMPEDLAYLAIVESGYRSDAHSPAGAAGAWQFMPYTGQKYGLVQDWWTDERLDPFESTEAAAEYLQKLYGDFGDWPTAIAAYNAGEGKVGRAKSGTGGRNFYEITSRNHTLDDRTQLREETKQYVPRFIAVAKIMRNLPQLGFDPVYPDSASGVLRLTAKPGTDLKGMARACRMDWDTFSAFNRHHKRSVTDTGRSTFVYVPSSYGSAARAYLASPQGTAYAGWKPCAVASNTDSWEKISRRSGVSVDRLRSANPGNASLKAGETILVPRSVDMSAAAVAALDRKPDTPASARKKGRASSSGAVGQTVSPSPRQGGRAASAGSGQNHVLQGDETLSGVALQYGVSVADLQEANGIANPNLVHAGAILRIPGRGPVAVAAVKPVVAGPDGKLGARRPAHEPEKTERKHKAIYTVQANDTLWKIARAHNVSVDDLKRWNGVDEKRLRAGAALVVEQ